MKDAPSFQRQNGDWTFLYFLSKAAKGDGFVGAVEIRQKRVVYCRRVSVSSMSKEEAIIDHLEGSDVASGWLIGCLDPLRKMRTGSRVACIFLPL